jgi:hypothetical protein
VEVTALGVDAELFEVIKQSYRELMKVKESFLWRCYESTGLVLSSYANRPTFTDRL